MRAPLCVSVGTRALLAQEQIKSPRCKGADSRCHKARRSSASSCWTDNPAVRAARFQVGGPEDAASQDVLSEHYCNLRTKPFYNSLVRYMTSGPLVVMVWEGHNVVQTSRTMVGHTNPAQAQAGTVRGDFSIHVSRNVIHASDSVEGAEKEIQLWFQAKDLLDWNCWDQISTGEL
ncbi:nucleoside diphosphate kinase A-like isoform X2 [Girardinichthys multiradiatus]|uniref:nucleoside diphosphate kinase A-like isoform X2 n=1 Tax=Girardinichthys multiradiatus TaxID=208333 RepID=UPI001FAD86F9|nr:nucleoside diphosphate kinase A-like isoform X2 [Girardinichthys multiradiatus]